MSAQLHLFPPRDAWPAVDREAIRHSWYSQPVQAFRAWCSQRTVRGKDQMEYPLAASTVTHYTAVFRKALDHFEHKRGRSSLFEVTAYDIKDFLDEVDVQQPHTRGLVTKSHYLGLLNDVFEHLCRPPRALLANNPCKELRTFGVYRVSERPEPVSYMVNLPSIDLAWYAELGQRDWRELRDTTMAVLTISCGLSLHELRMLSLGDYMTSLHLPALRIAAHRTIKPRTQMVERVGIQALHAWLAVRRSGCFEPRIQALFPSITGHASKQLPILLREERPKNKDPARLGRTAAYRAVKSGMRQLQGRGASTVGHPACDASSRTLRAAAIVQALTDEYLDSGNVTAATQRVMHRFGVADEKAFSRYVGLSGIGTESPERWRTAKRLYAEHILSEESSTPTT